MILNGIGEKNDAKQSFKKTTTPIGASHAVHFMTVISQVQSCMKGLTQNVMDVFDSKLLPGKDYFDPDHHSEKPSPLEDHLELFVTPLKDHGYIVRGCHQQGLLPEYRRQVTIQGRWGPH